MDHWKVTLDSIDFRFKNIEKHLNITPPLPKAPIALINITPSSPSITIPLRPTRTIVVSLKPLQNPNNCQNKAPTTVNISPVASTSTTANNNNNNTLTVQGLTNEFNTMQEDILSLKSMLSNLTSMLQNAIGQPQKSNQCSAN